MPTQDGLLQSLREEATEMKACFTRYSFQTISISLIALGIVARTQKEFPQMGLVSSLIILLVLAVLRIGIYKYYGANRIYGFELHVARIKNLKDDASDIPLDKLMAIPWEEAMRAWRIVQPTIFRAIYEVKKRRFIRVFAAIPRMKSEFRNKENLWFQIRSLIHQDTVYYSGSYLRTMFSILFVIVFLAFLSMGYMAYQVLTLDDVSHLMTVFGVMLPIFITVLAIQRLRQLTIRRHLLEDGLTWSTFL